MVRSPYSSGFTIIEVMLFLAISGLMIVGMFVGISGSINRQRYDDAVSSFQDYIQGQYNIVDNVRNNRPDSYICSGGSISTGSGMNRGTSDCTLAGRLITTTDGSNFVSEPVIATGTTLVTDSTEVALLDSLGLTRMPTGASRDDDTYRLAWSTRVYAGIGTKATLSTHTAQLLILRIPTSGVIRTYFRTSSSTAPLNQLWNAPPTDQLLLCVEPDGLTMANANGVKVLKNAVNTNSVQFITAGEGAC